MSKVLRRTNLTPKQLGEYTVGRTFVWAQFTSTSTTMPAPEFGRVLFEIDVPSTLQDFAMNIQEDSQFDEEEILICPNTALKVLEHKKGHDDTDHHIHLQMMCVGVS